MSKTVHAASGHTLYVEKVDASAMPTSVNPDKYTDFYTVKNWDAGGVLFFYMAKGYHDADTGSKAPKEVHVWYRNGEMWSSFGENFKSAIDGAQRDGWMHAISKEV